MEIKGDLVLENQAKCEADAVGEMKKGYKGFAIVNHEGFITAGDTLREIKGRGKRIEGLRVSMTKPLDDAKKKIMEFFRQPLDDLAAIERMIKTAMVKYQNAREEEQREEQRRAREEAKRVMERDSKTLEERITEAALRGDVDGAQCLTEEWEKARGAVISSPVAPAPAVPRVDGVVRKKVWKWEVVDIRLVPMEYLKVDDVVVGTVVRSGQGKVEIPGIRMWHEDVIASRGE